MAGPVLKPSQKLPTTSGSEPPSIAAALPPLPPSVITPRFGSNPTSARSGSASARTLTDGASGLPPVAEDLFVAAQVSVVADSNATQEAGSDSDFDLDDHTGSAFDLHHPHHHHQPSVNEQPAAVPMPGSMSTPALSTEASVALSRPLAHGNAAVASAKSTRKPPALVEDEDKVQPMGLFRFNPSPAPAVIQQELGLANESIAPPRTMPTNLSNSSSTPQVTSSIAAPQLANSYTVPVLSTTLSATAPARSDPLLDQLESELQTVTASLNLKPYQPTPLATAQAQPSVQTPSRSTAAPTTVGAAPLLSPSYQTLKHDLSALTNDLTQELNGLSNDDAEAIKKQFIVLSTTPSNRQ